MLCEVCFFMLRGQEGRLWQGTYDLRFNHHQSIQDLQLSARMRCGICRVLLEELNSCLESRTDRLEDQPLSITASLSVPNQRTEHLYCLEFKLDCAQIRCRRTFVLKETSAMFGSLR
jgi:hypothetical protein